MGHLANYKYYGDVYSAPEDYTSYEYFNEKRDYLPTVSTLKQIYESLSGISGITFDIDVSEFPVVEETLHKVGMPVCSVRDAILHISFLTGAFVNDANRKITFYKLNDTVKEISSTRILNDAKIEKIDISNINLHYYTYGMFRSGIGYFTSYQTVYEDYAGNNSLGYVRQGTSCYMCNIIPSDAYGGNYAPVGHNDIRVSVRGSANENEEIFFEKPVSSFNLPTDLYLGSYQGDTPTNPNYSPAGEILNRPIAVPYNISDQIINIKFSENGTTKDIEEHLLSREMVQAVSERVKSDFSYNRKAIVKIVDGFDKVYYGEHFYGEMTYGYTEQEPIDVGDRVSFTVRNKQVNGIVTRVSYNLNGTIKIKECEVMYKE